MWFGFPLALNFSLGVRGLGNPCRCPWISPSPACSPVSPLVRTGDLNSRVRLGDDWAERRTKREKKSWFGSTNVTLFDLVKSVLKKSLFSSFLFNFARLTEKVSRVKEELVSFMSLYTYLALGFSIPVGAKLSHWRLGINSFGAPGNLHRSYTQCDHCHAGAKLFCSYFRIISFRRQISSTYRFYTT